MPELSDYATNEEINKQIAETLRIMVANVEEELKGRFAIEQKQRRRHQKAND